MKFRSGMHGRKDGQLDNRMGRWINGHMSGQPDGKMGGRLDG